MLDDIRKKIDDIDNSMKPLFLERLSCSRQVAEAKAKTKEEVYVPKREEEIIADRIKRHRRRNARGIHCVFKRRDAD